MSLKELNTALLAIEEQFDALKKQYPQAAREAATARVNYELAQAEALDTIAREITVKQADDPKYKPNADEKSAMATLRTADLYRLYRETDAEVAGLKMLVDVVQSQLTSIQTRSKLELIESGLVNAQVS